VVAAGPTSGAAMVVSGSVLNRGDGGSKKTQRSSVLAVAGLASNLGATVVVSTCVGRWCNSGDSGVSAKTGLWLQHEPDGGGSVTNREDEAQL